jgi:DNA-directed RNA polymerase subunit alpha
MTLNDNVLGAPLSVLGLNIRATNALLNNGLSTVGDVLAKTEIELWQLPGVGPGTMMEIKAKLSARGLTLRPGPPLPERK